MIQSCFLDILHKNKEQEKYGGTLPINGTDSSLNGNGRFFSSCAEKEKAIHFSWGFLWVLKARLS